MVCTGMNNNVHCSGRLQQHAPLRLPVVTVKSLQGVVRPRLPVVRVTAVDQPSTEAAVAATASPADSAIAAPLASDGGTSNLVSSRHPDRIRIAKETNLGKAARHIASVLQTIPAGDSLLVTAVGQESRAQALKAIARASTKLAEVDSSSVITFQPRRRQVSTGPEETTIVTEFYVQKAAAEAFASEMTGERRPMYFRNESTQEKVVTYVEVSAQLADKQNCSQPIAQVHVSGGVERLNLVLAGIIQARRKIALAGQHDIMLNITISAIDPLESSPQQQQQQVEGGAATSASATAADASDTGAAELSTPATTVRYKYTLSIYTCDLRPTTGRPSQRGTDGPSVPLKGVTKVASVARPSFDDSDVVEVPAAEWVHIQEQLQLVSHLTEQLQIMTQQHEQLLSLLATQQQQQQPLAGEL